MEIEKITYAFDKVDAYYLELYDKQKQFNKQTTETNRKEVETALRKFKKHWNNYERLVKNTWINDKWEGRNVR